MTLEHTLLNGLYDTYMPTWRALDERSGRDVIAYIKTFSSRFATEKPQDPIVIPPDPGYSEASVARGDKSTDIYRVFMAALSGTPMPTFTDSLNSADAWDLVHFIQRLSPGYAKNMVATIDNSTAGVAK